MFIPASLIEAHYPGKLFSKAENIRDVLRYVRKFKNTTVVIYIDDRIIHSSLFISHIKDICSIHETGIQVIIIPGARQRIDQVLEQASIPWTMKDDIRLTNAHALFSYAFLTYSL